MVYKLDGGTVINSDGNLVIENIYAVENAAAATYQARSHAYHAGGYTTGNFVPPYSPISFSQLGKYTFASSSVAEANTRDFNSQGSIHASSQNNREYGYVSGGTQSISGPTPSRGSNTIDKFQLANDNRGTDQGDLTTRKYYIAGHSSSTNGYVTGGTGQAQNTFFNDIEKFPFATDANSVDVADLTLYVEDLASGVSSQTHGYTTGGYDATAFVNDPSQPLPSAALTNVIQKFPFSSDTNATDVGDLAAGDAASPASPPSAPGLYYRGCNLSSFTNGYLAGGQSTFPLGTIDYIQKFPFATDTNAVDAGGTLVAANFTRSGSSSYEHGYVTADGSSIPDVTIQRFSFAAGGNSADVGDLAALGRDGIGMQGE